VGVVVLAGGVEEDMIVLWDVLLIGFDLDNLEEGC
jgi:hypothetical protein